MHSLQSYLPEFNQSSFVFMLTLVVIFSVAVLLSLAAQVRWGNAFVRLYRNQQPIPANAVWPRVGVVMSLRGADPYLEDCLRGMMELDYPNHEIRIIVDSDLDPAWELVNRIVNEYDALHVTVEPLELRQQTSSLKNSALVQAIGGCSAECEAFAWLDSDTVPYRDWLKDMVYPLQDSKVGAACGIRWYAPPDESLPNYVRHLWNSAAIVQMLGFQIGWGGSFAIRRSVIEETNLIGKWERALTEDTLASDAVLENGKRLAFVPAATMPNFEATTLSWCLSFVTRQLQVLRYYHRAWRSVVAYGIFSGVAAVGCVTTSAGALLQGNFTAAAIGFGTLGIFGVTVGWLMRRAENEIVKRLGGRAISKPSSVKLLIAAFPITQLIQSIALMKAYRLKRLTWRGIRYTIRSGLDITRENYAPYEAESSTVQHSL